MHGISHRFLMGRPSFLLSIWKVSSSAAEGTKRALANGLAAPTAASSSSLWQSMHFAGIQNEMDGTSWDAAQSSSATLQEVKIHIRVHKMNEKCRSRAKLDPSCQKRDGISAHLPINSQSKVVKKIKTNWLNKGHRAELWHFRLLQVSDSEKKCLFLPLLLSSAFHLRCFVC